MLPIVKSLSIVFMVALVSCSQSTATSYADEVTAQLRDTLSPAPADPFCVTGIAGPAGARDPGFVCPTAKDGELRTRIYKELAGMGTPGVTALARAYESPDVHLRRGVALALIRFGEASDPQLPAIDIEPALPSLIKGLNDNDEWVRSWSAQAIASLGPRAASAVPALLRLLSSAQEGDRIGACIALRGIGSSARDAYPGLRRALNDPSRDVREFAQLAIADIGAAPR